MFGYFGPLGVGGDISPNGLALDLHLKAVRRSLPVNLPPATIHSEGGCFFLRTGDRSNSAVGFRSEVLACIPSNFQIKICVVRSSYLVQG